jgi:hypothetical protein
MSYLLNFLEIEPNLKEMTVMGARDGNFRAMKAFGYCFAYTEV